MIIKPIKPCPFCGYKKPLIGVDSGYPRRAWVECPLCEAKGPTESIPCGMTEEEAAVDAWNDANWRDE